MAVDRTILIVRDGKSDLHLDPAFLLGLIYRIS